MRRRQKPRLDASGNLLVLPPQFQRFNPQDWPGSTEYHRWESWWDARSAWALENDAPDDLLDLAAAGETAPQWTAEDIARII